MRANLKIELTGAGGEILAVRCASNSVMQAGAKMIAGLFAGTGKGITHMGVGISDTPESDSFSTAALSNDADTGNDPLTERWNPRLPRMRSRSSWTRHAA